MKAHFFPVSQVKRSLLVLLLVSLIMWIYPEARLVASTAQETESKQTLVFEVQNQNFLPDLYKQNFLSIEEVAENEELSVALQKYLENKQSPLAEYSAKIISHPNWKKALAISWVESNMCRRQVDNNCSGIGVAPGHPSWREYKTFYDWFVDMDTLLSKPIYSERFTTFRKMKGVYVQPGSERWVRGAEKIFSDLTELENQAKLAKTQTVNQKFELAYIK